MRSRAPAPDGFVEVCRASEIRDGRARIVTVDGERVAIFRYCRKALGGLERLPAPERPAGRGQDPRRLHHLPLARLPVSPCRRRLAGAVHRARADVSPAPRRRRSRLRRPPAACGRNLCRAGLAWWGPPRKGRRLGKGRSGVRCFGGEFLPRLLRRLLARAAAFGALRARSRGCGAGGSRGSRGGARERAASAWAGAVCLGHRSGVLRTPADLAVARTVDRSQRRIGGHPFYWSFSASRRGRQAAVRTRSWWPRETAISRFAATASSATASRSSRWLERSRLPAGRWRPRAWRLRRRSRSGGIGCAARSSTRSAGSAS